MRRKDKGKQRKKKQPWLESVAFISCCLWKGFFLSFCFSFFSQIKITSEAKHSNISLLVEPVGSSWRLPATLSRSVFTATLPKKPDQLQDFQDFRALPRFKVHFCSSRFLFTGPTDRLAWDWLSRGFRAADDDAAAPLKRLTAPPPERPLTPNQQHGSRLTSPWQRAAPALLKSRRHWPPRPPLTCHRPIRRHGAPRRGEASLSSNFTKTLPSVGVILDSI